MVDIFEELTDIRNEKGELDEQIEDIQAPLKEKMTALKAEMIAATKSENDRLSVITERESIIKTDLANDWPYEGKEYTDVATGIKLQKKKSDKPEVLDMRGLLEKVLTFDELPIKKVNFDNRKLITLSQAGVISRELVDIHRTHNIAVTFPKE